VSVIALSCAAYSHRPLRPSHSLSPHADKGVREKDLGLRGCDPTQPPNEAGSTLNCRESADSVKKRGRGQSRYIKSVGVAGGGGGRMDAQQTVHNRACHWQPITLMAQQKRSRGWQARPKSGKDLILRAIACISRSQCPTSMRA